MFKVTERIFIHIYEYDELFTAVVVCELNSMKM